MGGSGILILYDFEKSFLDRKAIKELTIKPHPSTSAILSAATLEPLRASLAQALARVDDKEKAQAYQVRYRHGLALYPSSTITSHLLTKYSTAS